MRAPIGSAGHTGQRERSGSNSEVRADLDLAEVIEAMEAVDWSEVPGISTAEAAAWNSRLEEAHNVVRGRSDA